MSVTMHPGIRAMDAELIAQIKAGEVIERPASVVKELVENALDARARRIRVEIQDGGTSLIRVIDDGIGISPDELPLAFAEHTSSKLHSPEDLDSIGTLGFRGEALHAISNVSEVEAISGLRGDGRASSISIDHGRLVSKGPVASGGGTRVAVHHLFGRVPARRKHLKSPRAESAAVNQLISHYALGHPSVCFTFVNDDRTILSAPGSGNCRDAFAAVYGADLVSKTIEIASEDYGHLEGLVCTPEVSRPNRNAITLFVNGRPVRSAALMFAVEDAYSGLLMLGRHPIATIRIDLPPDQIDANVHPAKTEVRFLSDRAAFSAVRSAVLQGLSRDPTVVEARFDALSAETPTSTADVRTIAANLVDSGPPNGRQDQPRPNYPEGFRFDDHSTPDRPARTFANALPVLRVFGQAASTFIIADGPGGLYMIDQHAAHERVLFDALRDRLDANPSQPLLQARRFDLSPEQGARLEERLPELLKLGFEIEPFGENCCIVRSVPVIRSRPIEPEILIEVLDGLPQMATADEVQKQAMTVVACKAAVKAGQSLSMEEMREIVSLLHATTNPRSCPHGRPTMLHLSTERLEREFGRR